VWGAGIIGGDNLIGRLGGFSEWKRLVEEGLNSKVCLPLGGRHEHRAHYWIARPAMVSRLRATFHAQGWDVIATMRTPREDVLPRSYASWRSM
jgi:hypothetical protein